jgi:hypothetical protein
VRRFEPNDPLIFSYLYRLDNLALFVASPEQFRPVLVVEPDAEDPAVVSRVKNCLPHDGPGRVDQTGLPELRLLVVGQQVGLLPVLQDYVEALAVGLARPVLEAHDRVGEAHVARVDEVLLENLVLDHVVAHPADELLLDLFFLLLELAVAVDDRDDSLLALVQVVEKLESLFEQLLNVQVVCLPQHHEHRLELEWLSVVFLLDDCGDGLLVFGLLDHFSEHLQVLVHFVGTLLGLLQHLVHSTRHELQEVALLFVLGVVVVFFVDDVDLPEIVDHGGLPGDNLGRLRALSEQLQLVRQEVRLAMLNEFSHLHNLLI